MKARQRRSRRSLRTHLRTYWIVGALGASLAFAGGWLLARAPALRVAHVEVGATERVDRSDVLRRAAIDPGANAWLIDVGGVERRVEAIPYVRRAHVVRRLPAHVAIAIEERLPDGCLRSGEDRLTIDREQRVLERGCRTGLPTYELAHRLAAAPGVFLHDPNLAALQRDAAAIASADRRYAAFFYDDLGQFEAVLGNGIRVRFGSDDDLERKQRLVEPILASLGPRLHAVAALDVRAPGSPVVEYRAGALDAGGTSPR